MGSTFHYGLGVNLQICQDVFGSENDRKHPTKLFYYAFLLLALFPSSSLSSSSLEALASDDHWLPLNQGMEFKVESFASKSSGVWRSKIWSFFEGQMQTPLKIGYYRPLWEGFIHLYDYNAFFKMVWGPKHKFLHFFRNGLRVKTIQNTNLKKRTVHINVYIYRSAYINKYR